MCINISPTHPLSPLVLCGTAVVEEVVVLATFQGFFPTSICSEESNAYDCLCDLAVKVYNAVHYIFLQYIYIPTMIYEVIKDTLVNIYECLAGYTDPNMDPAASAAAQNMCVNRSRISERPAPLPIPDLDANGEEIPLNELVQHAKNLFPHDPSVAGWIDSFVNYASQGDEFSQRYFEGLRKYARGIIIEMRKPELPQVGKRHALSELADAMRNCTPRIYAEGRKQWLILTNCHPSLDQQILAWLQEFKENLITSRFQTCGEFHPLNYARRVLPDWGLDNDAENLSDPFATAFGGLPWGPLSYRYMFNKEYTAERLIAVIKTRLDLEPQQRLNALLEQIADQLPGDWLETAYEANRIKLNHRGVAWLLQHLHFLT